MFNIIITSSHTTLLLPVGQPPVL